MVNGNAHAKPSFWQVDTIQFIMDRQVVNDSAAGQKWIFKAPRLCGAKGMIPVPLGWREYSSVILTQTLIFMTPDILIKFITFLSVVEKQHPLPLGGSKVSAFSMYAF